MVQYLDLSLVASRSELLMIRSTRVPAYSSIVTMLVGVLLLLVVAPADATSPKKKSKGLSPAASVALQYAEAISNGDKSKTANLDFACQYRLKQSGPGASAAPSESPQETCWHGIKGADEPALARVDGGMEILWPTNGALPFFRDDLDHYPASSFVMD